MIVEFSPVGPFQTNAFVVGCPESKEAAVVDAGFQSKIILAMAQKHNLKITQIFQTHSHIDHVSALADIKTGTGGVIHIHKEEMTSYHAAPLQAQMFGLPSIKLPEPDNFIEDGDQLSFGLLTAKVIFTPGHTAGGVCFYFEEHNTVFVGDTLFAGSVGRTDLPGGDFKTLLSSISRLMELPDETKVYCGHGPSTTIGVERGSNPFVEMINQ